MSWNIKNLRNIVTEYVWEFKTFSEYSSGICLGSMQRGHPIFLYCGLVRYGGHVQLFSRTSWACTIVRWACTVVRSYVANLYDRTVGLCIRTVVYCGLVRSYGGLHGRAIVFCELVRSYGGLVHSYTVVYYCGLVRSYGRIVGLYGRTVGLSYGLVRSYRVVWWACTVVMREPFDFSIFHTLYVRNLCRIFHGLNVRHRKPFRKRSRLIKRTRSESFRKHSGLNVRDRKAVPD